MAFDTTYGIPYEIELDIYDKRIFANPYAKQYDKEGRYFVVTLFNNGAEYIIPTGASITFQCKKRSQHILVSGSNKVVIENNKIYYRLEEQVTAVNGDVFCEFVVTLPDGTWFGTPVFKLYVETGAISATDVSDLDEVNVLNDLITRATDVIAESEIATQNTIDATTAMTTLNTNVTNAEVLRVTAENTRKSNETTRVSSESTRGSNENTRISAETTRGANETARISAESTRSSNESTRVSSESTRVSNETTRQAYYNAYKVLETYDNTKGYVVGNKVTYNGSTYQCILSTTGNYPTTDADNTYWKIIAKKGIDGVGGDMMTTVFDPQGKKTDIFAYTDNKVGNLTTLATSDKSNVVDAINSLNSDLNAVVADGTGTAITLPITSMAAYINYRMINFIASANNNGAATTININSLGAKNLYKPNTTTAPTLIAGKAYTVWYNGTSFFIKASADGTAIAENVLAETTFSNDLDTGIVGTMPNREAVIITPGTANQAIQLGYHDGNGYVVGDTDLISANIKAGINIFGVDGNPNVVDTSAGDAVAGEILNGKKVFVDGTLVVGNMTNWGSGAYTANTVSADGIGYILLTPNKGYYDGSTVKVVAYDAEFIASNIVSTANIFGMQGTFAGKKYASGTATSGTTLITEVTNYLSTPLISGGYLVEVTGLPFTPRKVFFRINGDGIEYELNGNTEVAYRTQSGYSNNISTVSSTNYIYSTIGGFRALVVTQNSSVIWEAFE